MRAVYYHGVANECDDWNCVVMQAASASHARALAAACAETWAEAVKIVDEFATHGGRDHIRDAIRKRAAAAEKE